MSKRKLTYKDLLNYFRNNLQNKEKHSIEKEIMRDAFEEEAFEGLSKLNADELDRDITELKSNIAAKSKKTKRLIPVWFRYAASVIVLVGIGLTIVFLNSRFWQDSLLKEQVAKEMEIADSMEVEAKKQLEITTQKPDTVKTKPEELIAESKEAKTAEKEKQEPTVQTIVEDKVVFDAIEVSEDDYVPEAAQEIEIIEFEEEEEVVEEDLLLAEPQLKAEEEIQKPTQNQELNKVHIDKKETKSSKNIRIRGVASQPAKESPLLIIDGIPVDMENLKMIKGKVLNSENNHQLSNVLVELKDMELFETKTDVNGEFSLLIPDDQELQKLLISYAGMQQQEIDMSNDSNLIVYMEPRYLAMDDAAETTYNLNQEKLKEVSETNAKPSNGLSLRKYKLEILEMLDYSKLSAFPGKHNIEVSFTVGVGGELYNFNFKNIPDIAFSNEIKKAILEMGKWQPATLNGVTLESTVKFTLKVEIE
ncbi:MAG: carboxypeptidase-like regulatory domain-containing protein [Bacteroidetes bacterium]|nr:carboxypeptidase-like regulatory domain-containing protein [Bacteroidota bacterium]